jgi:hypothetical protein
MYPSILLQCLRRAPGRRVTEKSHFSTKRRSGRDRESNPGHLMAGKPGNQETWQAASLDAQPSTTSTHTQTV